MCIPGGWWLGSLDLFKELVENPDQVVIVDTTEDLGDKCSTLDQKLHCKLQAHEDELGLGVGVLNPCRSDVGGTIV